jgi:DNA-directed RNA polymerase specialized sigma24 family protein
MRTESILTKEQFDLLLAWLDPTLGRSGERYEAIRRKLITFFLNRQCDDAESLADDTINRVARKVNELKDSYVGEQGRYFLGVAKKVLLEHRRMQNRRVQPPPPAPSREEMEPYLVCLDECLAKFPPESRELILLYHMEQKKAKIAAHREMGDRMSLKAGALRARVHRIRVKLEQCVRECLERAAESNNIGAFTI